MYCNQCGRPINDDQVICDECAAAQNYYSYYEQPVQETFDLNYGQPAYPQEPPKKKTGLIVGIAAGIVVLAATLLIILNLNSISNFFIRTFASPEDYLLDVQTDAVSQVSDEITKAYGQALSSYNADSSAVQAQVQLRLSEDVLALLAPVLAEQGLTMDLNWLSDIRLNVNANSKNDMAQFDLGLGLGETSILSVDAIADLSTLMVYLTLPGMTNDYLYLDMNQLIPADEVKDVLNKNKEIMDNLYRDLPSESELNEFINRYVKILLSAISSVEKEDTTITVNGISQDVTLLKGVISQEALILSVEEIVKTAETDPVFKKFIVAIGNYANGINELNGYDEEKIDLYAEFTEALPDIYQNLQDAKQDLSESNYIAIDVYVDNSSTICGEKITVFAEDDTPYDIISFKCATKDNTAYTEINIADELIINGKETQTDGKIEGSYDIVVDGTTLFTIELSNVTQNSGILRLIPGEEMLDDLLSGYGIPATMLSDSVAIQFAYSFDDSSSDIDVDIILNEKSLIGIGLATAISSGSDISIPENAKDATLNENLISWIQGLNFESTLNAMTTAGVPQELVDVVQMLTASFQSSLAES